MIRLTVLLSILLFLLTGCYGFKDIDKRFFVLAIGVDKTDDEKNPYLVTLKLGIPSAKIEPGQTNKSQIISQKGGTISEAIRLMKSKVDKEFDFGQTKIYLFGKSVAAENIVQPLDWFNRRRDIQLIGYTAIGDPSAADILKISPKSERLPVNALILSFDLEGTESAYTVTENLSDFYRRLNERGKDPYMPVIKAAGDTYLIDQVAVFDKKKMKAVLTPDQTRVFYELVKGFRRFDLVTDQEGYKFVLTITALSTKYSLKDVKTARPTVRMKINMRGMAEESNGPLFYKKWSDVTEVAAKQSKERILNTLNFLRDKGVDPIGFGLRYRAMGHVSDEEWTSWEERYPNLQFDLDVRIKMVGTGVIK